MATTNSKTIKAFSSDVTVVEGERAVMARITTNAVDRDGEVVIPQGLDAKQYQLNPVIFYNHAWADWQGEPEDKLPVGKCAAIKREDDAIVAKIVFAERPEGHPEGEVWMPDTLLSLYQQGVMNAFSIGFIPTETRPATDRDVEKFGAGCRRVVSKSKLFEVSCVPIPCNQEAVTLAVSKGLLTQDAADKMFAVKAGDGVVTINEARGITAIETPPAVVECDATTIEAKAAVVITPKHLTYVIANESPVTKTHDPIAVEVSKRRGRLYYV